MFYIQIFRLRYAKICRGIILTCRSTVFAGTDCNLKKKRKIPGTAVFNTATITLLLMKHKSSLPRDHKVNKNTSSSLKVVV